MSIRSCSSCAATKTPRFVKGLCIRCYERVRSAKRWRNDADRLRGWRRTWLRRNPDYFRTYARRHSRAIVQRVTAWRKGNPGKLRDYSRAWAQRRRARKANAEGRFSAAEWTAMVKAHRNRCAYCRRQFRRLTQDHVVPLTRGGRHDATNIVPSCRSCNSRKGQRTQADFIAQEAA